MEMYLQFGHGMMGHCRSLLEGWGGGTVILSPRDLNAVQIVQIAGEILSLANTQVLVDPQVYLPHSTHERLQSHNYWPSGYATGSFFTGPMLNDHIHELVQLNNALQTSEFIVPGFFASSVDTAWLDSQKAFLEEARNQVTNKPLCQTIALSAAACQTIDNVGIILEAAEEDLADCYYLVCGHPDDAYFVPNPTWIVNVLDIAAGLKLLGSRVVLGYSNQQMLVAAIANIDAIASGTWMNVRAFDINKFNINENIKKRSTWYYCPESLSEYKLTTLDSALNMGILGSLAPVPPPQVLTEVSVLFSGAQPTNVRLSMPAEFRHYLQNLHHQAEQSVFSTFDTTISQYRSTLDNAEALMSLIGSHNLNGYQRDFSDALDANREALAVLESTRGPLLRHEWANL